MLCLDVRCLEVVDDAALELERRLLLDDAFVLDAAPGCEPDLAGGCRVDVRVLLTGLDCALL